MQCVLGTPSWQQVSRDHVNRHKLALELRIRLAQERMQKGGSDNSQMVIVQFLHETGNAILEDLETQGVNFERFGKQWARKGSFVGARVEALSLAALLDCPHVKHILPAVPKSIRPVMPHSPFADVHRQTQVLEAKRKRDTIGRRHTGEGTIFADFDTGIDVLHPMFFYLNGGLYDWIDVNANGTFDPDIDAADLNHNGKGDDNEVLIARGGAVYDTYGDLLEVPKRPFEIGQHWLIADTNQNGRRDAGIEDGFQENDLAFGEPVFVADDVNGDGILQTQEKLIRLGTSKIRAVIRTYSGKIYARGEDLIETPTYEDCHHGTGVGGILVGGAYGHSQIDGVATHAELINIDQYPAPNDPSSPRITWLYAGQIAQNYGANIFVHEYGSRLWHFADGSDPQEQAIDAFSDDGIVQVTATHNFAGVNGNSRVIIDPESSRDIDFLVEDPWNSGWYTYYVYATVRWQGANVNQIEGEVQLPSGIVLPLSGNVSQGELGAQTETDVSSRKTGMLATWIYQWDGSTFFPLENGLWTFTFYNYSDTTISPLQITLADHTGHAYSTRFLGDATDEGTMAWPSTADSAISVGACSGNPVAAQEPPVGDLMYFSGRGPRIDGAMGIDVVAPQDHFTALFDSTHMNYMRFGGTSGALPQVAASIALLLQAEPTLTPAEVKARVQSSASSDSFTGTVPNNNWGYGKLSTFRMIHGVLPDSNTSPIAHVQAQSMVEKDDVLLLDASLSSDEEDLQGALIFRWDLDYDGTWDEEYVGQPTTSVALKALGSFCIKLEVEDTAGAFSQMLHHVQVVDPDNKDSGQTGCQCRENKGNASVTWWLVLLIAWRYFSFGGPRRRRS